MGVHNHKSNIETYLDNVIMADGYQPKYNRLTSTEERCHTFDQWFSAKKTKYENYSPKTTNTSYNRTQVNHSYTSQPMAYINDEDISMPEDSFIVLEPMDTPAASITSGISYQNATESEIDSLEVQFSPCSTVSSEAGSIQNPNRPRAPKRATREPLPEAHRPGKRPAIPDSRLTETELIRKNRRRERNREAAARQRIKRDNEKNKIKDERDMYKDRCEALEKELKELKDKFAAKEFGAKYEANRELHCRNNPKMKTKLIISDPKILSIKKGVIGSEDRKRKLTMSPSLADVADPFFDLDLKKDLKEKIPNIIQNSQSSLMSFL